MDQIEKKNDPVLLVVGARPNFVKMAPVCRAMTKISMPFRIVHTGQHYDLEMSDIFFKELGIPSPDFNLDIGSGAHGYQTGHIMLELEKLCKEHSFSMIVVIGDVNSTLAGALVGSKSHIPVAHVESGLRSFNRKMPEEINRIVTDHISDLLFAPTTIAMNNLENEGLSSRSILSGDVSCDMTLTALEIAEHRSNILNQLRLNPKQYYLTTLHRPYNVDDKEKLTQILAAYAELDLPVILPVHPRLKKQLTAFRIPTPNVRLIQPLGYFDFIWLLEKANKVLTDSGGVQKEAFFTETPCITLRPETEWVETLDAGANKLVKTRSKNEILKSVFGNHHANYDIRVFGDGKASEKIVRAMHKFIAIES